MKDLAVFVAALLLAVFLTFFLLYTPAPQKTGQNISAPAALPPVILPPLVPAPPLPPLTKTPMPPRYRVTVLPVEFEVSGLNNKGELVGTSEIKEASYDAAFGNPAYSQKRAVVWANGKRRVLPTIKNFPECTGLFITDASLVGGTATLVSDGAYLLAIEDVVLWNARAKKPAARSVGSGGFSDATLSALNVRGQAVGWSSPGSQFEKEDAETENETRTPRAFFWDGKQFLALGSGWACGLNDRGQVVGLQKDKIVLWQGAEKRILCDGVGYAINNRGQIVGTSDFGRKFKVSYMALGQPDMDNPNPPPERKTFFYPLTHALLYENGKPRDLGVLPGQYFSCATALNDRGQIVGTCTRQNDYQYDFDRRQNRAFLWQAGRMAALNALLPKNSGWNLTDVKAINNRGQIVGVGSLFGKERSYLLTPQ